MKDKIVLLGRLEGMEIRGYYTEAKEAIGTILHFHGFPGEPIYQAGHLHQLFTGYGYSMISFNYPGFWKSELKMTPSRILMGSKIALEYALSKNKPVFLYAESFGGSVATAMLAHYYDPMIKAMGARAPVPGSSVFSPERNPIENGDMFQLVGLLRAARVLNTNIEDWDTFLTADPLLYQFSTPDNLKKIREENEKFPISIIFGKDDEVLNAREIEQTYSNYAKMEIKDHLSHNEISQYEWEYIASGFVNFFNESL